MKRNCRPFPYHRLPRLCGLDLDLAKLAPDEASLDRAGRCLGQMARTLGLGGAEMKLHRVRSVQIEELRSCFPGRWPMAVFADLSRERAAALALDPLLVGRALDAVAGGRAGAGRVGGGVAAMLAAGLEQLSGENETWQGWRYAGLLGSAGELGRTWSQTERMCVTWLRVRVGWDEGCVAWLEPEFSASRRKPQERSPELAERLPLLAAERLGACRLTLEELKAVARGDLLVLDEAEACLGLGELQIKGRRAGLQWIVESIATKGEQMSAQAQALSGLRDLEAVDARSLPMSLVAVAGHCRLSVGRVAGLRPGDVLDLDHPLMDPMEIRCADRLLGKGELVEVDGRRALRITEWALEGQDDEQVD